MEHRRAFPVVVMLPMTPLVVATNTNRMVKLYNLNTYFTGTLLQHARVEERLIAI
jgi:hypothetical protein